MQPCFHCEWRLTVKWFNDHGSVPDVEFEDELEEAVVAVACMSGTRLQYIELPGAGEHGEHPRNNERFIQGEKGFSSLQKEP